MDTHHLATSLVKTSTGTSGQVWTKVDAYGAGRKLRKAKTKIGQMRDQISNLKNELAPKNREERPPSAYDKESKKD